MAWHAAKRALPVIAASSDVRALLTGGIYDNKGKAAWSFDALPQPFWKIRVNNEGLLLCVDVAKPENEPENSFT